MSRYLLNHQAFCVQTWYCDASLGVQSVMQKDCFAIFKVKATARAHMIKIWQFLLYLLNCWSFCYHIWFDSTLSYARVFYGDSGLLCSKSRSLQNFKISLDVCSDDIFWITESFTTKLCMLMHHCGPDCLSKRLVCCLLGQGHS